MWFKKKQPVTPELIDPSIAESKERAAIEIVANKGARAEIVEQARIANKHVRDLIEDNNFTVTIFIAAGGKHHKSGSTN